MNHSPIILGFLAGAGILIQSGHAGLDANAARKVAEKLEPALVSVRVVVKIKTTVDGNPAGPEREVPSLLTGTVVNPDGWVVVSSFQLNPFSSLVTKPFKTERNGRTFEVDLKARLDQVRILTGERVEVPARVVAEEADLGLAVLAPDPQPSDTLPRFEPVDWNELAQAAPFTSYLALRRANATFKHQYIVEAGVIGARLEKPRPAYLQDYHQTLPCFGGPFIDLNGRLLGIGTMNFKPPENPASGILESWPAVIVVPAADIREWLARVNADAFRSATKPAVAASDLQLEEHAAAKVPDWRTQAADSIVVLEGSVKYNCGRCANEHESEVSCIGTVLDPEGLVVVTSDGRSAGNRYLRQELRFILADRSEVPAEIVLEDDDLMLTVLAPVAKAGTDSPRLKALTLRDEAQAVRLDEVVTLSRLDRSHRHAPAVSVGRVVGLVEKPRLFLKVNAPIAGPLDRGRPAFLPDGQFLGVLSGEPADPAEGDGSGGFGVSIRESDPCRVVPASALRQVLEQAKKLRASADKTASSSAKSE